MFSQSFLRLHSHVYAAAVGTWFIGLALLMEVWPSATILASRECLLLTGGDDCEAVAGACGQDPAGDGCASSKTECGDYEGSCGLAGEGDFCATAITNTYNPSSCVEDAKSATGCMEAATGPDDEVDCLDLTDCTCEFDGNGQLACTDTDDTYTITIGQCLSAPTAP